MVECNLACDAAVFSPKSGATIKEKLKFMSDFIIDEVIYTSIFTFMVETLDPEYHSFPVHMMVKNNGFADESIESRRAEIIEKLTEFKINFKFKSTDGDKYFDIDHDEAFLEYKDLNEKGSSFDEIIDTVEEHSSEDPWPLSDPLHLIKNFRTNGLFREMGLSIIDRFDQDELKEFVKNVKCLEDKSSAGAMKDSYPMELFGFESFIASIDYTNSNFFICPLFLFMEALRNKFISDDIF